MKHFVLFLYGLFVISFSAVAQFNIPVYWTGGGGGGNTDVCGLNVLTLTADPIPPGLTYRWVAEPGWCTTGYQTLNTGSQTIYFGESREIICQAIDSLNQVQGESWPIPIMNPDLNGGICDFYNSGNFIQGCLGDTILLRCNQYLSWSAAIAVSTPGDTVLIWQKFGVDIPGTLNNWSFSATTTGEYQLKYKLSCGTSYSNIIQIEFNPGPVPVIGGDYSICAGTSTTLCANGSYVWYIWSNGATTPCITANTAGPYTVTVSDINGCTGTNTVNLIVTPDPVPVIAGDSTLCLGQTAVLNVGATYTSYLWNTSDFTQTIVVSSTGTYTVTVTDINGCSGTDSIQVTGPTAVLSGNATICSGMNTNLTVSFSGDAPYTYTYSNGTQTFGPFVTNQNPATISVNPGFNTCYSLVSFNDNNCAGSVSGMACITIYPIPSATLNGNYNICPGAITGIFASFTGTPPFAYSYYDGSIQYGPYTTPNNSEIIAVSPSVTTTYTLVYFTDSYCNGTISGSATVTVNQIPIPTITGDSTLCPGQSTNLDAGGGYSNYQWNTGNATQILTTSILGTYFVIVTDANGCIGTDSITLIAAPPYATILSASGPLGICQGDSVQLTAQSPMSSYQWYKNNVLIPGATALSLWAYTTGWYKCLSTDLQNCPAASNQLRVRIVCFPPIDPGEKYLQTALNPFDAVIFPNPTAGESTIRFNDEINGNVTIRWFDTIGKQVHLQNNVVFGNELNLDAMPPGFYFLEVRIGSMPPMQKSLLIYRG